MKGGCRKEGEHGEMKSVGLGWCNGNTGKGDQSFSEHWSANMASATLRRTTILFL